MFTRIFATLSNSIEEKLRVIEEQQRERQLSRYYSLHGAAWFLGISEREVQILVENGQINYVTRNGIDYIKYSDIVSFISHANDNASKHLALSTIIETISKKGMI